MPVLLNVIIAIVCLAAGVLLGNYLCERNYKKAREAVALIRADLVKCGRAQETLTYLPKSEDKPEETRP